MIRLPKDSLSRLLVGAVLALAVLVLHLTQTFEGLELKSYDLRFHLRGPRTHFSPHVFIVGLDDETTRHFSVRARDFPRSLVARAVKNLADAGASVIALDFLYSQPSEDLKEGNAMVEAMTSAANVVLAGFMSYDAYVPPFTTFRDVEAGEGTINVTVDGDGVIRRLPVLSAISSDDGVEEYFFSLNLEAARLHLFGNNMELFDPNTPGLIRINSLDVVAPENQLLINYYGPPGTFSIFPLWKAVTGEIPKEAVEGKVVLIGPTHPSLADAHPVPFSQKIKRTLEDLDMDVTEIGTTKMYGVEIHAHALQTILDGAYIHRSSKLLISFLIFVLGATGAALFVFGPGGLVRTLIAALALIAGICVVAIWLFAAKNYWLDFFPLLAVVLVQAVGGVAYHQYRETQRRREVTTLFGKYVSPGVVQRLMTEPDLIRLQGSKERLTIFFSDIRGFTSMSEKMDPVDVTALLNEYFSEMSALIFKYNGTLDKFMGDAVMAFFGNPIPYPDHALRAVLMALEMQAVMDRLNKKWTSEGRKPVGIGIGINTGDVTVGNLGSDLFFDYTIIGDAVNLACRLEQSAEAGQILISRSTYEEVMDAVEALSLPAMTVKGKEESIEVYQVIRPLNPLGPRGLPRTTPSQNAPCKRYS